MCKLIDKVIPYEMQDEVYPYVDDMLLISETFDDHIELIRRVAKRLKLANLTVNIEKSRFVQKEIPFLGYLVGEDGLKPNPQKIDTIVNMKKSTTVKELRRFLGMCQWFMRMLPNYSTIAASLTSMTGKNFTNKWSSEAEESFNKLKEIFTTTVLVAPDYKKKKKTFYLHCDGCSNGVGDALIQIDERGNECPVAYMSRKLSPAQKKYSVSEIECLVVIEGIRKFRPYFEGTHFVVVTDHAALKWLMSTKDLQEGRLARWALKLQHHDFEIIHRKGSNHADMLSRVELGEMNFEIDFESEFFRSQEYLDKIKLVENSKEKFASLKVLDGKLYKRVVQKKFEGEEDKPEWRLWVPGVLRQKLIENYHCPPNSSHPGINKLLEKVRRMYYWPKMFKQVKQLVNSCEICLSSKVPNRQMRPSTISRPPSLRPFKNFMLTMSDRFPGQKLEIRLPL